jgi:hypothetical protein
MKTWGKKPPHYITGMKNISPFIQLFEQIAKQQHEIRALSDNQVKVQPKISECYGTMAKYGILDFCKSSRSLPLN